MATYYVERRRTRHQHVVTSVEADSPAEARDLVGEMDDPADDQWDDDGTITSWVDRVAENEQDLGYT
jgi:hypothetical protein